MATNGASLSDESEKPATKKQKTASAAGDDEQPSSTPPELIIQRFRFASVRTSAAAAAQQQRLPLALSGAFKGEFSIHHSGDPLAATGLRTDLVTEIAPGGPLSAWGFLAVDVDVDAMAGPGGVVTFSFRLLVDEYEEDDTSNCVDFSCAKEDLASIITSRGG